MSSLVIRPKDYKPWTIRLEKLRSTIGRSSRNDICISDPFASRIHAELRCEGEQVTLADLGSANGTYLNGHRLMSPALLNQGDNIRIGETIIEYQGAGQGAQQPANFVWSGSEAQALPADTITTTLGGRTTSDLLTSIRSGALGVSTMIRPSVEAEQARIQQAGPGSKAEPIPYQPPRPATGPHAIAAADAEGRRDLLGIVSKVGIALLPQTSLEETMKMVMDLVFDAIPAERGFLFLKEGEDLNCKIARGVTESASPSSSKIQLSRSITSKVLNGGASVLTSDALHDPRFQAQHSIVLSQIRSVMAVPLASGEGIFGMIYVDNPFDNRFTEDDLNVFTTVASVASIKIEHQRLLEERLEKRRMEEELKVASEIQLRLQPVSPPQVEGWDMTGVSFPCREIGGDYYDFIECRKENRIIIALGDVSGKGTGAALMMSSVHAAVRAQTRARSTLNETMNEINNYIFDSTPLNKFVTLFCGALNPETGELEYSNAGHNQPLLVRTSGSVEKLDVGGIPIGIIPDAKYEGATVTFEKGDVLVIYSDGISESVNERDEEFGVERMIEVIRKNIDRSASGLRDRIDEALSRFVGTAAPVDDMTLVIVKRTK